METQTKPRGLINPGDLTVEILARIDREFWERALHLAAEPEPDAHLAELYATLLRPLGAIKTPETLACTVRMYRQLRSGAERRFAVSIGREAQDAVLTALIRAGYDV